MADALAAALAAAGQVLGNDLVSASLFGSRARGDATHSSDIDVLLLCRKPLSDEALLQLELASTGDPPVRFEVHAVAEVRAGLADAEIRFLEMLRGRTLLGAIPAELEAARAEVIARFGLKPAPWIGKGVWVAERDLPEPATQAALERAAAASHPDERIDRFLRALLSVRVRGDLSLARDSLIALIAEHILSAERTAQLEPLLGDPAEAEGFVRRELRNR